MDYYGIYTNKRKGIQSLADQLHAWLYAHTWTPEEQAHARETYQSLEQKLNALEQERDELLLARNNFKDSADELRRDLAQARAERDSIQQNEMAAHQVEFSAMRVRAVQSEARERVLREALRGADVFMMVSASGQRAAMADLHRLRCPNRELFSFEDCPYFSCKMTREHVTAVGDYHRDRVVGFLDATAPEQPTSAGDTA